MQTTLPTLDLNALKRLADGYSERLVENPTDAPARINLAWCLLMQAVHRTGESRVISELAASGERVHTHLGRMVDSTPDRDAAEHLRLCLRETFTISQLCADESHRAEVKRLQELVRLSGGEAAVTRAEAEALDVLRNLTAALFGPAAVDAGPN